MLKTSEFFDQFPKLPALRRDQEDDPVALTSILGRCFDDEVQKHTDAMEGVIKDTFLFGRGIYTIGFVGTYKKISWA